MDAMAKLANYIFKYGIDAVNLCIKRHKLGVNQRTMWSYQHVLWKENQKNFDKDMQQEIDKMNRTVEDLKKDLQGMDEKLLTYGINVTERKNIIRAAKTAYPKAWEEGFFQED